MESDIKNHFSVIEDSIKKIDFLENPLTGIKQSCFVHLNSAEACEVGLTSSYFLITFDNQQSVFWEEVTPGCAQVSNIATHHWIF